MGALVGGLQAAAALGLQITLRQLGGLDPGPSSSVRKLVGMYQMQDARELALEALGSTGADAVEHGCQRRGAQRRCRPGR